MSIDSREASKQRWSFSGPTNCEQISTGSLQRIADVAELMANNYQQLIDERDRYKRWYGEKVEAINRRDRTISALRGQITKLHNQKRETP